MAARPGGMALRWANAAFAAAVDVPVGLPLLHWPDGRLCEPTLAFFAWLADTKSMGISSMRPLAYALRQWFAWVAEQGRPWTEPDDGLLGSWRDASEKGDPGKPLDAAYVERKLAMVFSMYASLPTVLGPMAPALSCDGCVASPTEVPAAVGRRLTSKPAAGGIAWTHARYLVNDPKVPVVMDAAEVAVVLARLRAVPMGVGDAGLETALADGRWIAGRLATGGGLRAAEIAGATVDHVATMLRRNRIAVPPSADPSVHPLDALADDDDGRKVILAELDARERSGRSTMRMMVWGKGRRGRKKRRPAVLSVDLVRDLLVVGVWSSRRALLARRRAQVGTGATSPEVLLSSRTFGAFRPGSIGDMLKDACNVEPVIDGSGHRMRAFSCVELGVRFLRDCLVLGGGRITPEVEGRALALLAEAMGHKSPDTTLLHYFELAKARFRLEAGSDREISLRAFWADAIGPGAGPPKFEDGVVLRRLARALSQCVDGERLRAVVAMAVEQIDLQGPRKGF